MTQTVVREASSVRRRLLFRGERRHGHVSDRPLHLDVIEASARSRPVLGCELEVAISRPVRQHADDVGEVALGVEAVQDARGDEREDETLGSLKPLTAPPKGLLTDVTIKKFQDTIRDIFISADTPMTKNYLRFLVERIVVGEDRIEIQAKAQNAVAFMGRMAQEPGEVLAKESEWLRLLDSNQRPSG